MPPAQARALEDADPVRAAWDAAPEGARLTPAELAELDAADAELRSGAVRGVTSAEVQASLDRMRATPE